MIQIATLKNAKELFDLESSVFSRDDFPMSLNSFYYHIKNNLLFISLERGKIVGYILWLKRKEYYRLYSLCVDKEVQGKGIAQELLEYSFEKIALKSYSLEVKITNEKAIKLYEKNGFKKVKILKNYYPNGIDGYLMRKKEK